MSAFKEFKLKTPHTAAKKISGTRELGEFSKGGVAMPGASKILALPPLLGGAKIAAVVLHTMNIEGQIHQKNLGMGQTTKKTFLCCSCTRISLKG